MLYNNRGTFGSRYFGIMFNALVEVMIGILMMLLENRRIEPGSDAMLVLKITEKY